MALYESQKEEFSPEAVLSTSRHLITMLSRHKDSLNFANVKELLETIQNADTTDIPPKSSFNKMQISSVFSPSSDI